MKEKIKFIMKVVLTFVAMYFIAAIVMEGIVIVGFYLKGYDVLQGNMPMEYWISLVPLYGFLGFIIVTIVANRIIRKKKLNDMRLYFTVNNIVSLLLALIVGAILVGVVVITLCELGAYQFDGLQGLNFNLIIVTFIAYLIQGTAEEMMCRGFLQNYLEEKVSRITAIVISAIAFIAPHFSSLLDLNIGIMIISLLNIFLVSVLFSLAMIKFDSLLVSIGIHVGWNYMLSYVCGLELTGMQNAEGILHFKVEPSMILLHGGAYGIEAGIIVTILLFICDIILYRRLKEK